ncbi:HNH endonuclease [Undibacterium sp. CY21W]|uniref:HNH endonuclease n=1 Tax=Undibacterium sp. CY21W TaxID=2762293 RepID=UPI00164C0BA4|nr:HNH endonuclease signature motif containing protein [Undibacterium sp. CY21W]MBC3927904.1 HNH endonuclease [Undibacterium sp. CY21W]
MNLEEFFIQFQDFLSPKLDTYEQAIYLYIFRHSRLIDLSEVTIGFKSARTRMACGTGEKGKPMSENTAYLKLTSLEQKGCISIIKTTHTGRLIKLHLPHEIDNLIIEEEEKIQLSLEEMDFFNVPENRLLLLQREGYKCFYTFQDLDESNFVVEHVVSRPNGGNGYKNLVAASREANNKKGNSSAENFLRRLFREGFLSESEFQNRIEMLAKLKAGELKPILE